MAVTFEMIAHAKKCDCEECKKYLADLEETWGKDWEKALKAWENYSNKISFY